MSGKLVPQSVVDDANRDIVDVVRGYIPELKKAGKDWVACCPFHNEKSPSFSVSESKKFFYCYGCGASGDAVEFVMMHQGLSFRNAVKSILGELKIEGYSTTPRVRNIKADVCHLACSAEDREKSADVMSRTHLVEQHTYLMRNNTASNIPVSTNSKGVLIVPMINNIGETVNVAAILTNGMISYAAGKPSFGATAIIEPEGEHDGKTIICADYAHAWRIWWAQRGKSRVIACMDVDNFRWMLISCKDRYTHVGCDPSEADEHIEYGRGIVALPIDPYAKLDRIAATA